MMKKILLILFCIPIALLVLICLISQIVPDKPPKDFLIVHNFVDLKQMDNISKYRSCAGHRNMPQYTQEPNSSAKHYMQSNVRRDSGEKVKIFAPFDGYIVHPLSQGVTLVPASSKFPWWPFNQWRFNVEPVHTLPQYGGIVNKVKAGDLIGYFSDDRYKGDPQPFGDLDIVVGVTAIPPQFKDGNGEPWKRMESVFNYMSDEVFAEYKAAIPGLEDRKDLTVPLSWRKVHPCTYRAGGGPYFDIGKPEDLSIEEQNVYLGVNIKDLETIKKRTIVGPGGVPEVGKVCDYLNNRFNLDGKTPLICAKQDNKMIWTYGEN